MSNADLTLESYELLRPLGRGNTSQVRLARDPEGREVALKLPLPETLNVHDSAEQFGNEVRLTMKFRHPHLVRGHAGLAFGPGAFLALDYYPDGALSEYLERLGNVKLPLEQNLRILADIASALTYMHGQNAVHQDVKPQNIYVNNAGRAALGDLGSAYFVAQGGKVSGSPFYMAPEIYHAEGSSSASDVYSLGITMYELLTGQRPFVGSSYEELMIAHLTRFAPPIQQLNPQVPRQLARLAEQALAKRPHERPTAEAIHRALLAALGEAPTEVAPSAPTGTQHGRHIATASAGAGSAPVGRSAPAPAQPAASSPSQSEGEKRGWNPFKRKK